MENDTQIHIPHQVMPAPCQQARDMMDKNITQLICNGTGEKFEKIQEKPNTDTDIKKSTVVVITQIRGACVGICEKCRDDMTCATTYKPCDKFISPDDAELLDKKHIEILCPMPFNKDTIDTVCQQITKVARQNSLSIDEGSMLIKKFLNITGFTYKSNLIDFITQITNIFREYNYAITAKINTTEDVLYLDFDIKKIR